jgi:hypothetical protein
MCFSQFYVKNAKKCVFLLYLLIYELEYYTEGPGDSMS